MGLKWVLFNLTGTLVDPTVLAQPLGDSGADEDLVLAALDDTVAMAMVDALTGDRHQLDELMAAAMRRRLRLAGTDEERATAAFELVLSAQDAGAFKPDLRPYRYALEQTGAEGGSAVCMVSTHWWDVAGAKR